MRWTIMPVEPTSLQDALAEQVAARPDAIFLVDERGIRVSYAGFDRQCREYAAALASHGIGQGSVVSWQLPNWISSAVVAIALSQLGAIQNPLLPILREREVSFITAQARTEFLLVPSVPWRGFDYAALAGDIAAASPGLTVIGIDRDEAPARGSSTPSPRRELSDEIRWYFYTSGTTAEPKGARHVDAAMLHAARAIVSASDMTAADRMAAPAPITHIGGLACLGAALLTGGRLLVDEAFDPERTTRYFAAEGATLIGSGTPFFLTYLSTQRAAPEVALFPQARAFMSGGAPKPPSLQEEMRTTFGGAGIISGYGLTECPMLAFNSIHDSDSVLATTEGRAVAHVDIIAIGADGAPCAQGEVGELHVRGPQLMSGYVDSALDADAFDERGYLRTGDLAYLDEQGNITITGRVKDIIIRNMENVSAKEIEDLLFRHDEVADCAVIGLPDERVGERVCAVIAPRDPADPPTLDDLCAHLRGLGVSQRKFPEQLVVKASIPRNSVGKVLKAALREELAV
jgi:acyl-CoA synthetase (AMP-forming)/AMP-acid ligase II